MPRKDTARPIVRLDASAFAGVVLVLAFIVWYAITPHTITDGVPVDFVKVRHPVPLRRANREDALHVAITRDGKIFFGESQTDPDELKVRIDEQLKRGCERKVYVLADARARYGTVERALDGIRAAGVQDVAFLVQERKEQADARNTPK